MAEGETETNPRKKLKIDHFTDEYGDNSTVDTTLENSKLKSETSVKEKEFISNTEPGESNLLQSNEIDSHTQADIGIQENISEHSANESNLICSDDRVASDEESYVSSISDMSDLSGEDSWKARALGPLGWVYKAMEDGVDPRDILRQAIPDEADIPDVDNFTLWKLVVNLVSEPPPRKKLPDVNTLDDVIKLLQKCQKIMVLTGAGVSVSCGIPDFRSRNGIYARLAVDFPDLPDPQAMFDISYFKRDQRPFFKFAKEIFPGQFEPSKSHKFIRLIEEHGKLLRNYTQNIDTLEQVAGIKHVIQCHGSFATATCMTCHHKISMEDIKSHVMEQNIPWCEKCDPRTPLSIMKPDIVFFGESLPEEFHNQMSLDKDECDLLIVIGSSLKVRPVALIPNSLPAHVPQILINKEHLRHLNFDVELLGDCDTVINEICRRLGNDWTKICDQTVLTQIGIDDLLTPPPSPVQFDDSKPQPDSAISNTGIPAENENTNNSETADSTNKCISNDVQNSRKEMDNSGINVVDSKECKSLDGNLKSETTELVSSSCQDGTSVTKETDFNTQPLPALFDKVGENENVLEQPGCSYDESDKPELADNNLITSSYWIPKRKNVADQLGNEQFCFIPPCKYVFPEAEFYTTLDTDNDSDEKDPSMDSDLDFEQTHTSTTGSDHADDDEGGLNIDDDKNDACVAVKEQDSDQICQENVDKIDDL